MQRKKNQIDGNNNKPTMIQSAFFQNISCDFQLPPFFVTSHFSDKQQNWSDSYFAFAVFIHYSVSVPDPQPLKAQQLSEFQRGLQLRIRGYKCDLAWSAEHDKSFLCLGLTCSEISSFQNTGQIQRVPVPSVRCGHAASADGLLQGLLRL